MKGRRVVEGMREKGRGREERGGGTKEDVQGMNMSKAQQQIFKISQQNPLFCTLNS